MTQVTFKRVDLVKALKKHAVTSIIASILMFAVGVLMCIVPGYTSAIFIWITFGLFALAGLVGIFHFIFPGKGKERDPFALVFGILVVALFTILVICAAFYPAQVVEGVSLTGFEAFSLQIIRFISIFFGVLAIFTSILSLFNIGNVEKGYRGWSIASAIISLVLGILMVIFPVILWTVGVYLAAVYLIIVSIFIIVVCSKAIHNANKVKKAGIKVEADVVEIKDDGKTLDNK